MENTIAAGSSTISAKKLKSKMAKPKTDVTTNKQNW